MNAPRLQERCARWLLLLTLLHTVPALWITPVVAGTAPAAAILAFGVASLLSFERDGVGMSLFALGPALVYCAIGWAVAWLLAWLLERVRQPQRAIALAVLVAVPLASVYWPIYTAGGHSGSRTANLIALVDRTISHQVLLGYWLALHGVLLVLYLGHLLPDGRFARIAERWRRPALGTTAAALVAALLYGNYPTLVCRPLAAIGSGSAALCAARADTRHQRYFYELAAERGEPEALAWVIANTPDRQRRLHWLRQGADGGDAQTQFALSQHLMRYGGADGGAEAEQWLRRAAKGGHAPAMLALADSIARGLYSSPSRELLAERNAFLERAAKLGEREAMLRLAEHHVDGSMGYPVNLDRARSLYRELALADSSVAGGRLAELDAIASGLAKGDPAVMKAQAKRFLASPMPGPGVRARGRQLLEQLADAGDVEVRNELTLMLRTGSGGVERDLAAAKVWLIKSAQAGDLNAMERAARNFTNGREGFAVDYPEARRWFEAAITGHSRSDGDDAQGRVRQLRSELAHIDRLGRQAGGPLLGEQALAALGQGTDAESHYRYAMQLLAGHGAARRAEAIARLNDASRLGHAEAAWRLFFIYERGFPAEINAKSALAQLERAAANHHFDATRELAMRYEYGKAGVPADLERAIAMYEEALAAGHDNRYGWNLDRGNFNHFKWLESRLHQARLKQSARETK